MSKTFVSSVKTPRVNLSEDVYITNSGSDLVLGGTGGIDFLTNGSSQARMDNDGVLTAERVLIGTTFETPHLKFTDNPLTGGVLTSSADGTASWQQLSGGVQIIDADENTFITVEATTDENQIRMTTNGTERLLIGATGYVGIGTDTPISKLHLQSDTTGVANGIFLSNDIGLSRKQGSIKTAHYDDTENPVTFILADNQLTSNDLYIGGAISAENNVTSIRFHAASDTTTGGSNERMRITSGGVGIGTGGIMDDVTLHLHSTGNTRLVFTNTDTGISTSDGAFLGLNGDEDFDIWNRENTNIRFGTNGSERMRIEPGGNVGIGTNNPATTLEAISNDTTPGANVGILISNRSDDSSNKQGRIKCKHYDTTEEPVTMMIANVTNTANEIHIGGQSSSENNATDIIFHTVSNTTTTGNNETVRIGSTGYVGIGTSSPAAPLHVNNQLLVGDTFNTSNSAWGIGNAQCIIAGTHNADFNGSTKAKLLITGSDNDGVTEHYPVFIEDENGNVLYSHKGPSSDDGNSEFFMSGNLSIDTTPTSTYKLNVNGDVLVQGGDLYLNDANEKIASNGSSLLFHANGSEVVRFESGGNVGIGTDNPSQTLHVQGNTLVQGGALYLTDTDKAVVSDGVDLVLQVSGVNILRIDGSTGGVGIGTNSASYRLDVDGNIRTQGATSGLYFGSGSESITDSDTNTLEFRAEGVLVAEIGSTGLILENAISAPTNTILQLNNDTSDDNTGASISWYKSSGTSTETGTINHVRYASDDYGLSFSVYDSSLVEHMVLRNSNLGIGTNAPTVKLDVNNATNGTGFKLSGQQEIYAVNTHLNLFESDNSNKQWQLEVSGGNFKVVETGVDEVLTLEAGGNVGIGTNNPGATLHLHSTVSTRLLFTNTDTGGNSGSDGFFIGYNSDVELWNRENTNMKFATNGVERMRIEPGGNVGIGTNNPATTFEVISNDTTPGANVGILISNRSDDSSTKQGRIKCKHYDTTEEPVTMMIANVTNTANEIHIGGQSSSENNATDIIFHTVSNTTTTGNNETVRIGSTGYVGIGTSSPATPLHVNNQLLVGDTFNTSNSAWGIGSAQCIIAGTHNADFNGSTKAKLLITGSNNDSAVDHYPIFIEDENGNVLYSHKGPSNGGGNSEFFMSGNLSIDTTPTSTYKLNVNGDVLVQGGDLYLNDANEKIASNGSSLLFHANGSEVVRFETGGNVGIGTNNPEANLHVYGSTPKIMLSDSTTGSTSSDGSFIGLSGSQTFDIWNRENTDMRLATNGTARVTVSASGNTSFTGTITVPDIDFDDSDVTITRAGNNLFMNAIGNIIFDAPTIMDELTTTERNALSAVNGMIIYNSTTSKFQGYAGGSWVDLH
jgi:hypothetical protein